MANHAILAGKVHLYQRSDSTFRWCSTYLEGKKRRKSTKTDSLAQAKDFAEDWYLDLRDMKRRGELLSERTFEQTSEQILKEYEIITEGDRNAKYVQDHHSRLRNHGLATVSFRVFEWNKCHQGEQVWPRNTMKDLNAKRYVLH